MNDVSDVAVSNTGLGYEKIYRAPDGQDVLAKDLKPIVTFLGCNSLFKPDSW